MRRPNSGEDEKLEGGGLAAGVGGRAAIVAAGEGACGCATGGAGGGGAGAVATGPDDDGATAAAGRVNEPTAILPGELKLFLNCSLMTPSTRTSTVNSIGQPGLRFWYRIASI